MNNISFKDMNLNMDNSTTFITTLDNNAIAVLNYISVEDKDILIQLALQNSEENGGFNLIKLNMYKELYLIYLYTNIEFTEEEKNNTKETYDILKSNGIIDAVLQAIPKAELHIIETTLIASMEQRLKNRHSIASVLNNFINSLPANAQQALETINKFNPEDFEKVIAFATAANGGRPIY